MSNAVSQARTRHTRRAREQTEELKKQQQQSSGSAPRAEREERQEKIRKITTAAVDKAKAELLKEKANRAAERRSQLVREAVVQQLRHECSTRDAPVSATLQRRLAEAHRCNDQSMAEGLHKGD